MRKLLFTLSIALIAACSVSSQTIYPSSDFGVAGDSLFYTKVTLSVSQVYYFFQAGTNQVWNYSTFSPTTQYNQEYLNPTTAGYRPTFLTECVLGGNTLNACRTEFTSLTNLALPTNQDQTISSYTFTDVIQHDLLSTASLETNILGLTSRINGQNISFTCTYTSPDVVYSFPITYGNRDSSKSGYVIDLTTQGIDWVYHQHSKRVNYDDAWGNLTTPYTNYPSTIRQRSTVLHLDTLFYNGSVLPVTPTTDVIYSWFTPAQKGPVFVAHGVVGANGQETFTQIDYLDTVHCLTPAAHENYNPVIPAIGVAGSVNVNFNNTSTNANSYTWNFGDPTSGSQNTSGNTNSLHNYTMAGTYNCELIACNTVCGPVRCDTDYFIVKVIDSGQVRAGFVAIPSLTCVGDSVHFRNNSTNATSYSWNFGDNTTSTLQTPSHLYSIPGIYNVTLIATGGGLNDTATRTVTIEAPASAAIIPNGPTTFCNGDSVILAASGGLIYHWSTGEVTAQITVRRSGTYTVTAENTCGSAVSLPVTITVNTIVDTITSSGATTFCSGDSVLLQANTGNGLTYQWRKNGQIIINATQSTYYAKTTGNYTVNVTENGCRGLSNIIAVTVNATPAPVITIQGSSTICSGDSLRMTTTLDTSYTYQWHKNGINITGATGHIYYAHTSGLYTVFVSRNGCSATSNGIAVTVNPTPVPIIVTSGSNAVCAGDSLLLTTQSGAGYSYQWLLNGNNIAGATSETYYARNQGSYTVNITALGCSGTSSAQSILINPRPTANAGNGASLVGCNAATTSIGGNPSASGGTGPYQYLWTPAASLSSDTVADPTVSHLGATQQYTLLVTDANGCLNTSTTTVTVSGSNVAISLALTGDSAWCFGANDSLKATATVTGSSGNITYAWSPSTYLSSSNTASTVAKPTPVGSYTYNIVATDALGCQAGTSFTINVYPQPVATITANDTTAPCAGDSVSFSAGIGAGYSYQWLDGGSPVSGATNINYTTASAGNYSVKITEGICIATSSAQLVTIRPMPTASINTHGNLTFCAGVGVAMIATTGTNYTYQWYENGQIAIGDTLNVIAVFDSGTYFVQVTENGCADTSISLTTDVIANPADSIGTPGATTFCIGNSIELYASSGAGYTYVWENNGTAISGQTSDSLSVDSSGTYSVVVTSQGCSETSLGIPVTVNYYPIANITAATSTTFCGGDSVTLNAISGAGYTYQWQNDGVPLTSYVNMNITTMDSGLYNVVVTQNGCTDTSNSLYVTVLPLPAAAAYVSSATGFVCPGDSFYLYVAAAPGASVQWQLNGSIIAGATTDTISANTPGNYSVIVTGGGCTGTSNIVAVGNYTVAIPAITLDGSSLLASNGVNFQWYSGSTIITGATQQSYSPPGAGSYSVLVTDSNGCTQMSAVFNATGVSTISDFAQVSVYPNPANASISVAINTETANNITISLYDIIGDNVATIFLGNQNAGSYVHQASTAGLSSGIYLVKISDGTSTIVKRISIEH